MNISKLSIGSVVLSVSQFASAIGPFVHIPVMRPVILEAIPRTPISLNPNIKISPNFVTIYEPSTSLYVRTPRLLTGEAKPDAYTENLRQILKIRGVVDIPTTVVDPTWMRQYRDQSVLREDPKPLQSTQIK